MLNELDHLIMLGKEEFERIHRDEQMDDSLKSYLFEKSIEVMYQKVLSLSCDSSI